MMSFLNLQQQSLTTTVFFFTGCHRDPKQNNVLSNNHHQPKKYNSEKTISTIKFPNYDNKNAYNYIRFAKIAQ